MKNWIRNWNELLTLPIALMLWYLSPYLIRTIDPGAGTHDAGIFENILVATIFLFAGKTIIWLLLKIGAPKVYETFDDFMLKEDSNLTTWQKGKFSLFYFFGLLFAWVWLVRLLS